jgi:hypothetical protein
MIDFDICGIGTWSDRFSNADELIAGLESGVWQDSVSLQPELIPPRERRRAPHFVKMAIEVMQQACSMAGMAPHRPAIVFASQMSDMEITDYMCRVLAESPQLVSPTKFHNSVHNAAAGYWSIATESHAPANAIAAFDRSPSLALLEAAAQLSVEHTPVLVVMQDAAPPLPFEYICPESSSFAGALLIAPPGDCIRPLVRCRLSTSPTKVDWPEMPLRLPDGLAGNASARILPLLVAAMRPAAGVLNLNFPAAPRLSLQLRLQGESG